MCDIDRNLERAEEVLIAIYDATKEHMQTDAGSSGFAALVHYSADAAINKIAAARAAIAPELHSAQSEGGAA